jgi:hypothetical protein
MSGASDGGDRPGNVISLRKAKAARNARRAEGHTFCESGFHKWKVVTQQRFDVKLGKLVTAEKCERCGKERVRST